MPEQDLADFDPLDQQCAVTAEQLQSTRAINDSPPLPPVPVTPVATEQNDAERSLPTRHAPGLSTSSSRIVDSPPIVSNPERRRCRQPREESRPSAAATSAASREMPWSEEGEQHVIAAGLLDGDSCATLKLAESDGVTPATFFSARNRIIWETMLDVREDHGAVTLEAVAEELKDARLLEAAGGIPYLVDITGKVPTTAHARFFISKIREKEKLREFIKAATGVVEDCYNFTGGIEEFAEAARVRLGRVIDGAFQSDDARIDAMLDARQIRADRPPPEPETRLFIADKPIATPGNLQSVIAKAKSGKTAGVGATIAAAVAAELGATDVDTLRFSAANPRGRAVVVFDTEQSPADAHACVVRALKRAGTEVQPPWLRVFGLAGMNAQQCRKALKRELRRANAACGGIFAVVLDGVADFVDDVNEAKECNPFVAELHALAIEFDAPITCVIHSNEGKLAGDDGRGHLGKQLTRKAESNLLFKKVGEVTTVTSEKQRKAPITEADGVAFRWSDSEGRHVTCGVPASVKNEAKKQQLADLAAEVFSAEKRLKYRDLVRRIMDLRGLSDATAERRVSDMRALNVLTQVELGFYEPFVADRPQPSNRPQ